MSSRLIFFMVIILICISSPCQAQTDTLSQQAGKTRNIIGFVPSKANVINGWAVGYLFGLGLSLEDSREATINGLHTDVGPLQTVLACFIVGQAAGMFLARVVEGPSKKISLDTTRHETVDSVIQPQPYTHRLNGVSVGTMDFDSKFSIHGLQITIVLQESRRLNGVSVTGIASGYEELQGVMVSGVFNHATMGKGVQVALMNTAIRLNGFQLGSANVASDMHGLQIGLVNNSKKMRGVQIGLFNRIGKRVIPILNFSFR